MELRVSGDRFENLSNWLTDSIAACKSPARLPDHLKSLLLLSYAARVYRRVEIFLSRANATSTAIERAVNVLVGDDFAKQSAFAAAIREVNAAVEGLGVCYTRKNKSGKVNQPFALILTTVGVFADFFFWFVQVGKFESHTGIQRIMNQIVLPELRHSGFGQDIDATGWGPLQVDKFGSEDKMHNALFNAEFTSDTWTEHALWKDNGKGVFQLECFLAAIVCKIYQNTKLQDQINMLVEGWKKNKAQGVVVLDRDRFAILYPKYGVEDNFHAFKEGLMNLEAWLRQESHVVPMQEEGVVVPMHVFK